MYETIHSWGSAGLVRVGPPPARGPESAVEELLSGCLRSLVLAVWADPGWSGGMFRRGVASMLALPAGPRLMAALAALPEGPCPGDHRGAGLELDGMPPAGSPGNPCLCLLAVAAAWQACQGYAAARARSAVVDAAGPEPVVLPRDGARPQLADPAKEQLAAALRLSPGSAGTRIDQSRALVAVPEVAGMVAEGLLPEGAAVRIGAGLAALSEQDAADCSQELSRRVRRRVDRGQRPWTGTDAADCARRLAVRCPSHVAARRRAEAGRRVRRWSNEDGTATLSAVLPELVAERMYLRLTAMAAGLGEDPRPMDARRADMLADLVLGAESTVPSGAEVSVIIDAAALLGLAEGVAEVPGMGPLPVDAVRALAADSRWRAWIRDAAGTITATGTRTYQPSEALARLVRAREPHCRMPGCRRPAAACDLDHAIPWPAGPTTAWNLGPLCRRHHIQKTHAGWDLRAEDPARQTWTTPAGATITDTPEPACPG